MGRAIIQELADIIRKIESVIYKKDNDNDYKDALKLRYQIINEISPDEYARYKRYNHSRYMKYQRIRKRVETMLLHDCTWLTLTFDNSSLTNSTPEQRHEYVKRVSKKWSKVYIANIDYGEQFGREHYHLLIQGNSYNIKDWPYGYVFIEPVQTKNAAAISKYVSKFTNHSIKKSTKNQNLIYSRGN